MSWNEKQEAFASRLERLSEEKKMYLRKSLGNPLRVGSNAWSSFLSLNPPFYTEEEKQIYYFVACVRSLQGNGEKSSVGSCLKRAIKRGSTFENKFLSLTKCFADKNGNFESKLVSFFGKDILLSINTKELLSDLLHWNHSKKHIQEKWCRSIYEMEEKGE